MTQICHTIDELYVHLGVGKRYPVSSYAEASAIFCAARDKFGEGASETPLPQISNARGEVVARISYNGRVWAGAEYFAGAELLFCPAAAPTAVEDRAMQPRMSANSKRASKAANRSART